MGVYTCPKGHPRQVRGIVILFYWDEVGKASPGCTSRSRKGFQRSKKSRAIAVRNAGTVYFPLNSSWRSCTWE